MNKQELIQYLSLVEHQAIKPGNDLLKFHNLFW